MCCRRVHVWLRRHPRLADWALAVLLVVFSVSGQDGKILMTVSDDGDGGAQIAPGGGLAGLADRVHTVDGWFGIDSPPGGPTIMSIELPGRA
jgi:signal transduction histidine kinase